MFRKKKKNTMSSYENSLQECLTAYENLSKVLDQKTIELDKMIEQEMKMQEEIRNNAEKNYQMRAEIVKTYC